MLPPLPTLAPVATRTSPALPTDAAPVLREMPPELDVEDA